MRHTEGPWKVEQRTTRGEFVTTTHIVAVNKSHIAIIAPCDIEANAKLIAAAPDLLIVAREIWNNYHVGDLDADISKLKNILDQLEDV